MSTSKAEFINQFSKAVANGDAAFFVGAGFSQSAGYVNWRGLLKDIANDLNLDVDRESDLIALAQYHENTKKTRSRLNTAIIDEFVKTARATRNHEIVARIPVRTFWTTNYDTLIEDSLKAAGKRVDTKIVPENLAINSQGSDAVVYKMHGDVSQPNAAVITKDDYETYHLRRSLFTEKLKGDLIGNTFCFVGFSFTDPNIEHILSRVRILLGGNQRDHYCIMRKPPAPKPMRGAAKADYEYLLRHLELRTADLQRFAIQTVLIDDYAEITELLGEISKRAHKTNVFVSGSARDFSPLGQTRLTDLANRIGYSLIEKGLNVVSGFGSGIGDAVIAGSLRALYATTKGHERDRLLLRPFPRASGVRPDQKEQNRQHREDLISRSNMVVYLSGNKVDSGGNVAISSGVKEEYGIATGLGRRPIPLGVSGHAALEIWQEVNADLGRFYGNQAAAIAKPFNLLNSVTASDDEIVNAVVDMAKVLSK